ncbi:hypothetical protein JQK15_25380 [Sphingobium sp. BHU LFT2]|uniref:hypothetical protein n=1 Tax=Sphingobium sp. BHU LFT2 TaxID=2807634 RepID=UPI001BEBA91E|nr:hypothetical protein [Sphingobium sp. BHU LFT2]MBT2246841.1 hypothetical protein [Sphingobium sp. BHU LFT2]
MQQVAQFDSLDRRREKQSAREQDDRALREGAISPEALSQRNGFFSGIDFSRASVRRPRRIAA